MKAPSQAEDVKELAERVGLPENLVEEIYSGYLGLLRYRVSQGKTVKVFGLCEVGPKRGTNESFGQQKAIVSSELGIGFFQVNLVLNEMQNIVLERLREGYSVQFHGLARMEGKDGKVLLRSSVTSRDVGARVWQTLELKQLV